MADGRTDDRTFGKTNWPTKGPKFANDRGLGLAEMARAILGDRPHRASGDVALHVLAVMSGILEAATNRQRIAITLSCTRPEPFAEEDAKQLLKPGS